MAVIDIGDDPIRWNAFMSLRPEVEKAWKKLESTLHSGASSTLPLQLKENARVALSGVVGCKFCNSFGVNSDDNVSRQEQLARDFAVQIATDYRSVDQATFDALSEEFTNEQIVELTAWLCFKFGANVLGAITQLEPAGAELQRMYQEAQDFMVAEERKRADRAAAQA